MTDMVGTDRKHGYCSLPLTAHLVLISSMSVSPSVANSASPSPRGFQISSAQYRLFGLPLSLHY